jgi:hypothetical protein
MEQLRTAAPEGFAIYQKTKDKGFFLGWLSCEEAQLGLPTAVHESVHFITAENDAFPLIGGAQLKRPHEVTTFFAPSLIAARFKASDFVTTYLRPGTSSSSTDFLYLLDELNAYTHDLATAVALSHSRTATEEGGQVDHRDGLAALMAFVALYVERAEQSDPATWRGLNEPPVARTMSVLWGQAEKVMASSCGILNFGSEDKALIRQFCQRGPQAALGKIIKRAPICPSACLATTPIATRDDTPRVDPIVTGSVLDPAATPRPLWSRSSGRGPSRSDQ